MTNLSNTVAGLLVVLLCSCSGDGVEPSEIDAEPASAPRRGPGLTTDAGSTGIGAPDQRPPASPISSACPGNPDVHGIGAACSSGGGECVVAGDGKVAIICSCEAWDGVPAPAGTPCFCMANAPYSGPVPDWYCTGPAPDARYTTLGLAGTVAISYTLSSEPGPVFNACVPAACAGLALSR